MKKIILLFFVNILFLAGFSATTITFNAGTGTDAGCTYATGTYTITGTATIYVGNSNFTTGNVSFNAITSGLGDITIAGSGLSTLSTANNLTIKAYGNLTMSTDISNSGSGALNLLAAQVAAGVLNVNANLNTTGGALTLYAGLDESGADLGFKSSVIISYKSLANISVSSNGGDINIKNSATAGAYNSGTPTFCGVSIGSLNSNTYSTTINAGGGNIDINGTGVSNPTGSGIRTIGVYITMSSSNSIYTTGSGSINITGTAPTTTLAMTSYCGGIFFDSANTSGTTNNYIYTDQGNITLTGTGITNGTSGSGYSSGIYFYGVSNNYQNTYIYYNSGSISINGVSRYSLATVPNGIAVRSANAKIYIGYDNNLVTTSGNISFKGDVANSGAPFYSGQSALYLKGTGTLTIGSFNGTGSTGMTIPSGMIKDGFSQITLGDTYTGPIKLGAAGVLPDASQAIISGTLDMNTFNETIGALSGTGTITNGSTGTPILTCGDAANTTFSGSIQNSLALMKQGIGTLTLSGTNSFGGATNISSGTLALSSGLPNSAVTVSGTFQLNDGSSIGSEPTYSEGSNLVYSTGSSVIAGNEWNGTGSSVGVGVPNNVIINNNTSVEITGNRYIPGNFTISSGSLTVDAAKQFTVSGVLTNNGSLNLNSNENGTATLLYGSFTGNGIANVQQYLSSARNWYISSPVNGSTVPSGYTFYKRDESLTTGINGWAIMSSGDVLNTGQGYIALPSSVPVTYSFTGALNTGDVSVNLVRTNGVDKAGFNLIGNPYPSYVSLLALAAADSSNMETSYWIRSKNAGNTAYVFDTYNLKGQVAISSGSDKALTGFIAPMQAFWVRVRSGQTSGSLIFHNSFCSHIDDASNLFRAPAVTSLTSSLVRLRVSDGINSDEAVLYSNTNASNEYDDYDSQKMSNSTCTIPEIYTIIGSEELAINGLKTFSYNSEFPIGFRTGKTDKYTIKVSEINNLEPDTRVILIDNLLNTQNDITTSEYSFSSDAITTQSRFGIILKSNLLLTGIDNSGKDVLNIKAYKNGNNQVVITGMASVNKYGIITICNSLGQTIYSAKLTEPTTVINKSFISGVYFITVDMSGEKIIRKVTI